MLVSLQGRYRAYWTDESRQSRGRTHPPSCFTSIEPFDFLWLKVRTKAGGFKAGESDHQTAVSLLLSCKADATMRDQDGLSAVEHALIEACQTLP